MNNTSFLGSRKVVINPSKLATVQDFSNGLSVVVTKSKATGMRSVALFPSDMNYHQGMVIARRYPLELCEIAAGKDVWMKQIECNYADTNCKFRGPVGNMENGYCPTCIADAERENAIADGTMDA